MEKRSKTESIEELGWAAIRSVRQNAGMRPASELGDSFARRIGMYLLSVWATEYENENVPEPTCEGWWKPPDGSAPLYCWNWGTPIGWVCSPEGKKTTPWRPCSEFVPGWTGPLPVPGKEPTHSETSQKDFGEPCKSCARREPTSGWGWRPCSPSTARECGCGYWESLQADALDPSAPSEDGVTHAAKLEEECAKDEAKEWGKLLCAIRTGGYPGCWEALSDFRQQKYIAHALRFRTECVKPYEKLVELVYHWASLFKSFSAGPCKETTRALEVAHKDMMSWIAHDPELFVPSSDEPPKPTPSDEELGRLVLTTLRSIHHTLDVEYYSVQTYQDIGAAIRAKLGGKL